MYSAIWKNGPLYYVDQYNIYARDLNKEITLKCLYNSHNAIDEVLNEARTYLNFLKVHGITQDPNTDNFILVFNSISGNAKIDNFIQEMQLTTTYRYDDIVIEWIPYTQFDKIKETGKNGIMTVYSAVWKDGLLRCSHKQWGNAKKYLSDRKFFEPCGISQDPYTNDLILVQNNITWISGNKRIDEFIQEMQLNTSGNDIIFEWVPYTQFDKFKETGRNGSMTAYSAIWKDGPLRYSYWGGNVREEPNKEVTLKCLHNSKNPVEFIMDEAKIYLSNKNIFEPCGISQDPYTNNFILIQKNITWIS
ncbi:kinase-like domain-containing protein [Rhizophagus clarus]|nr:kinase-like domain-containing protein [Rhizophagus clarus]